MLGRLEEMSFFVLSGVFVDMRRLNRVFMQLVSLWQYTWLLRKLRIWSMSTRLRNTDVFVDPSDLLVASAPINASLSYYSFFYNKIDVCQHTGVSLLCFLITFVLIVTKASPHNGSIAWDWLCSDICIAASARNPETGEPIRFPLIWWNILPCMSCNLLEHSAVVLKICWRA